MTDNENKAFKAFKHDFKAAKKAKVKIDELITEFNDLYYGKSSSNSTSKKLKSKVVMKEIAKQIEWQKPNMTEPFLSTSNPIRVTRSRINGNVIESYLNLQFTSSFNRHDFIEQLSDVVLREGTGWVKSGWRFKEIESFETFDLTMQEILLREDEPENISQNKDGTFKVKYRNSSLDKNEPTCKVIRNEHAFPDPSAKTTEEMSFFCEEVRYTISELREKEICDEETIQKIISKIESENKTSASALENSRNDDNEDYGQDLTYIPEDTARRSIKVIEYWGVYDLNDDGIAEPIRARWAKDEDINLSIEDNPLPKQNIPYDNVVYSARPFSLWGNPLAYFIGDNQKIKTGIMRGVLDNMSLANNGQKFFRRGAIDYVNFKRMRNGERHIIVDKNLSDSFTDGSYNSLPNSVFQTMSMVSKESEDLGGVSSGSPALSNDNLSKDDTSNMQMTMSQQRMSALVRNISNLLSKVMHNWITMAEVFLSNEQIEEYFSDDEEIDYFAFKNSDQTNISIKVGTDVNRMMKMQQLNMLLQQSKQLEKQVPAEHLNYLVAEMYELFDMYEQATEIRNYKPEPSPMEQEMAMLEIQSKRLENRKIAVDIEKVVSDMRNDSISSQKNIIDAQAGAKYKQAQSFEKMAKADSHKVDSALKPAEFITNRQSEKTEQRTNI